MAKRAAFVFMEKKRVKRGVHAKSKTSKNKSIEDKGGKYTHVNMSKFNK